MTLDDDLAIVSQNLESDCHSSNSGSPRLYPGIGRFPTNSWTGRRFQWSGLHRTASRSGATARALPPCPNLIGKDTAVSPPCPQTHKMCYVRARFHDV